MPIITSANLASAIVKLVAADALPTLMGNLVMGNLVTRDYDATLAKAGDTVNVPIPPTLIANNILEGGSVQTQNPDLGNAPIVLNSHVEATFQIPDVTKAIAVPTLLKMYMQPAMVALAERVETDLLMLYSQFTTNAPLGVGGTTLTEAVIDQAETELFTAKVPTSEPKYLVVHPAAYSELRMIDRFTEADKVGPLSQAIDTGVLGRIKDFFVYRSQFVVQTGLGTGTVTTNNLAFSRDAMALAIRRLPKPLPGTGAIAEYAELGNFGMRVVMSYQPNTLAQQFTVDILYGCAVLRNAHGVQVLS
jgi:hypothetical protein